MTKFICSTDWDELHSQSCSSNLEPNEFEEFTTLSNALGRGFTRYLELCPGVELNFGEFEYFDDITVKIPEHDHLIQMTIFLSGLFDASIHPTLGGKRGYLSGSGISPGYQENFRAGQKVRYLNVEILPEVIRSMMMFDQLPDRFHQLFKKDEMKVSFYPTLTPQIRSIVEEMWQSSFCGSLRRIYLHAKVMELLVLHLDMINQEEQPQINHLRPDTVTKLHYAKELILAQVEHPLLISDLAKLVGISERSLLRGFKQLFGITPVKYLHQCRMNRALELLQESKYTVAEVARKVGYSNMGHFSAAFRRQFGLNPQNFLKS